MTECATSADAPPRPLAKLLRALGDPRAPVLITPALVLGFWLSEALIHRLEFGERGYLAHLLAPDAHELWMRFIVTTALLIIAVLWRAAALEHARSVAAMRSYQKRLHDMTVRLAYGDSFERRDLANRLHEDVGQQLVAARMFLASAGAAGETDHGVSSAARIIDRSISECREIAEDLSPPSLDAFGLAPALESLAERITRRSGVSVEVAFEECPRLDEQLMLLTFQVASEVLELAAHQAQTRRISVLCQEQEGRFSLALEWDSPATDDFFSADERITRAGGRFTVVSSGEATQLSIEVPLAKSA